MAFASWSGVMVEPPQQLPPPELAVEQADAGAWVACEPVAGEVGAQQEDALVGAAAGSSVEVGDALDVPLQHEGAQQEDSDSALGALGASGLMPDQAPSRAILA
jgi:hypothetical protein